MKTVIVADDEPIFRMDLAGMLTELGFTVAGEAADGLDAVELCRRTSPDIVLMDVKMPIFDGLSATETITGEALAGCVILLTAFGDRDIVERAKAAGAAAYLVKPIEQRMLLPTIEIALAQSKRLIESHKKTMEAVSRLSEMKVIVRAQNIIADYKGIGGTEAYNYLRRLAMDKRCSVIDLSKTIVSQHSERTQLTRTKQALMEQRNMSESKAYNYIMKKARNTETNVAETSISILNELRHGG